MDISFSTVIYEGNYEKVLNSDFIFRNLQKLNYNFDKKYFFINNVQDDSKISKLIEKNFPDFEYYFTRNDYFEILKKFNLTKEKLSPGYIYSIGHFNNFFYNSCNYNFHLSSDCEIQEFSNKFFTESINLLETEKRILVTMPSWEIKGPQLESFFEIGNFYAGKCFTDQCFFCKISEFQKDIYNYWHEKSNRYPPYGINSFERRIDSYIQNFEKYNAISKTDFYKHGV